MITKILNHKFTFIILLFVLIVGVWIFKDKLNSDNEKKVHFNENNNKILEFDKNQVSTSFIQTDKFQGKKDGYVFKADNLGLGYYIDK